MLSPLFRRLLVALLVMLLAAAGIWWATRPKPVAVVLKDIERGPGRIDHLEYPRGNG
jgi:HlyD family secretion protein